MPEWVYSVIAFVVVTVVIMFFVSKRKKSSWQGVLHKKRFNPGDMESSPSYSLVFKTEDGKKKRFQVTQHVFNEWTEGDMAEKVAGEFQPRRVE
jgi:hypothetical protein